MSPRSAEHLQTAMSRIADLHPKDPYINLAAAQSAAQQEDVENANRLVNTALSIKPDLTAALELKAGVDSLWRQLGLRALKYLKDRVNQFADNSELRLFYANALFDANQYKEAAIHLKKISDDKVFGGQALLFLGEISRKQGDYQAAYNAWNKALNFSDTQNNAQYLLGELSESQGKYEDAIKRYLDIETGTYHIPAQLRAAELLKSNKEYEKAIQVLHDSNPTTTEEQKQLLLTEIDILVASRQLLEALNLADTILEKLPNDEDTLLVHSTVAAKLKQWSVAEKIEKCFKSKPQ